MSVLLDCRGVIFEVTGSMPHLGTDRFGSFWAKTDRPGWWVEHQTHALAHEVVNPEPGNVIWKKDTNFLPVAA